MQLYTPDVPARYSLLLLDYIRDKHPGQLAAILLAAGLAYAATDLENRALTLAEWETLVSAAVRLTGRPDIGFEVGRRISLDTQGVLGSALQRCLTVDQGLRLAVRYFGLLTPGFAMRYRRNAQGGQLMYRPTAMMSPETLHVFYEIHAVSLFMQLKQVLQQRLTPYDVYLSMAAPGHAGRYRALAPARFHFGPLPLPEVRVEFESALLNKPLFASPGEGANEAALSLIRDSLPRDQHWSEWVVLMLREADGCQPTLNDLAGLMSISERSLTRYLGSEGRNFRDLAVQVRYERACVLLRNPANSVTQIACQLGYRHVANFSSAFRAASGQSPAAFRSSLATQGR